MPRIAELWGLASSVNSKKIWTNQQVPFSCRSCFTYFTAESRDCRGWCCEFLKSDADRKKLKREKGQQIPVRPCPSTAEYWLLLSLRFVTVRVLRRDRRDNVVGVSVFSLWEFPRWQQTGGLLAKSGFKFEVENRSQES